MFFLELTRVIDSNQQKALRMAWIELSAGHWSVNLGDFTMNQELTI
jgi:hypothetical protein